MTETATYRFESERQRTHLYAIRPDGITYHPPGRESITVGWDAIHYLQDLSGKRVDIVHGDGFETIPIFYGTDRFAGLLTSVCSQLARLHRPQIGTQTFTGSRSFFIHRRIVLLVLGALLLGGVVYLQHFTIVWLFAVAAILPMIVYILRQPHTVTPEDNRLLVQNALQTKSIAYDAVQDVVFDFHGDQHVAFLSILITISDNSRIKIQRFDNLILLFIFIITKWQPHREQ